MLESIRPLDADLIELTRLFFIMKLLQCCVNGIGHILRVYAGISLSF